MKEIIRQPNSTGFTIIKSSTAYLFFIAHKFKNYILTRLYFIILFVFCVQISPAQWLNGRDTGKLAFAKFLYVPIANKISITDGDGGCILFSGTIETVSSSIYGQRVSSQGLLMWGLPSSNNLIFTGRGTQLLDVVSDERHGAYVAYKVMVDPDAYKFHVCIQHVAPNGAKLWGDTGVVLFNSDTARVESVRLCGDGGGGIIGTWQEFWTNSSGTGNYYQLFTQKFDSSGNKQWGNNPVKVSTSSTQKAQPQIVSDSAKGAIIVFSDNILEQATPERVSAQRIDSLGSRLWGDSGVPVLNTSGSQGVSRLIDSDSNPYFNTIKADGSGGVFIPVNAVSPTTNSRDVYIQRLDRFGIKQWGDTGIVLHPNSSFSKSVSSVIPGEDQGCTFVYHLNTLWGKCRVFIQHLLPNGAKLWGDTGISILGINDVALSFPSVITNDGNNNYIVSWVDSTDGVRLQKVDHNGNKLWVADSVDIGIMYSIYRSPNFIKSNGDSIIINWICNTISRNVMKIYVSKLAASSGDLAATRVYYSIADGVWNDPAIWSTGQVPDGQSIVVIKNTVTVTENAVCYSLLSEYPDGNLIINTGANVTVTH